jgi:hypothetical protein
MPQMNNIELYCSTNYLQGVEGRNGVDRFGPIEKASGV